VSVRSQRYRLDDDNRLFDMETDPVQDHNVAADHKDISGRLSKARAKWKADLLPGLENDHRPFPVGYREFPITQLPARDGVPHGHIARSATAPNCSFFKNWISLDDSITWDVDVATAGKYEAVINYTCAATNVGSIIELKLSGSQVRARVSEAHDPPLQGAEHDRVQRQGESYVK